MKAGRLKFYRAGRQIRIDEADLVEYLSQEESKVVITPFYLQGAETRVTDRLEDKHATGWPAVRRLFTIEQAAEVSEEPVQEIWRRIRTGKLKPYHLGGGRVRIDEADLLASIEPRELQW